MDNYAKFSKNFQEVTYFPHQEKKKKRDKKKVITIRCKEKNEQSQ